LHATTTETRYRPAFTSVDNQKLLHTTLLSSDDPLSNPYNMTRLRGLCGLVKYQDSIPTNDHPSQY